MLGAVKREREQWHNENKSDKVEKISLSGLRMSKNLSFSTLTRLLNAASGILPEHRKGKNVTYSLQDASRGHFQFSSCSRHRFWHIRRRCKTMKGATMPPACLV